MLPERTKTQLEREGLTMEWKCTPDLYNTYENIDQADPKLVAIIQRHGFSFDEQYFYWQPRQKNGTMANIIKRRPLYWYPQKSTPTEKYRPRKEATQP